MEVKYYGLEKYSTAFEKWEMIRPYPISQMDQCRRDFALLSDYGDGFFRVALYTWVDDYGWADEEIKISNGFDLISKKQ